MLFTATGFSYICRTKTKYMTKVNAFLIFWLITVVFLLNACTSPESSLGNKENSTLAKASLVATDTNPAKALTAKAVITIDSTITMDYLVGKFKPAKRSDFALIGKPYSSRGGMYLRKEAYDKFVELAEAAKKDSLLFIIKSATRNFAAQKVIWEGKWNGKRLLDGNENAKKKYPDPNTRALKILEYSSMPGTSRHHWGTDFDVNAFTNAYFEKGKGLKEYEWLVAHADEYGFCQPYTQKGEKRPDGYNEEKWHWSYLPIAKELTDQYQLRITNKGISDFEGADTAEGIEVIRKYVLGINKACL